MKKKEESYLPLFLKNSSVTEILIIGGGSIASSKAEALVSVGCSIRLIAKNICNQLVMMCKENNFPYEIGDYNPTHLEGANIVIAATNNNMVNRQICADCKNRNILVNVVDSPELCDFYFPALVKRGPLQIAISSSGISPVLTRILKQKVEKLIPTQFENLVTFFKNKKNLIRKKISNIQLRRLFFEKIIYGSIGEEVLKGNNKIADSLLTEALENSTQKMQSALYLVGSGPGNPDLITVKASRILSIADVIIYDRLVSPSLIESYARKDAYKINAGKTRFYHHKSQSEINQLIHKYLKESNIVARLKGGDPGIYAHCAEEIAIAKQLGVPYHIIPGISAINGCAAHAGIPLTERNGSHSLRVMTLYGDRNNEDFWRNFSCTHQETFVFYMSSNNYGIICKKLQNHLLGNTPFLVIEQGTTPYHREYYGTLEEYEQLYNGHKFLSPSLLIVGRVINNHYHNNWKNFPEEIVSYFPKLPVNIHSGTYSQEFKRQV